MKIISSDKENILTSSKLFFKNTSSDLISSKNIYIISDEELTNLNVQLSSNEKFKLFVVENDLVTGTSKIKNENFINLTNVDESIQHEKFIYRISLSFSTETSGIYNEMLKLQVNDLEYVLQLVGEAIELDEKLLVTLQNFRHTFNDDYLIAFFESNPKSNAVDFELYNRKIREFLMNSHNLLAMHGSYKNLFDALQFFGYSDLLELREYWSNGNIYKSTSISNYVLNYIDKSLAGFKKTNKMSLVYQINEQTGFDEDGLPLYTTIFSATEEIMLKMEALKRILEKDFLHFNSFIVDIIGEMQTVIGLELNVLWQNAAIYDIHLTDNLYVSVEKILDTDLLQMKVNKVKVNSMLYDVENGEVVDRENFIDYDNTMIFEIDKIYTDLNDLKVDEYITNYHKGVFGIIKLDIILNKSRYQTFSYRIYNETEKVFEQSSRDIKYFNNHIICGIRKPGKYKIEISFIDWYGGSTFVGVNDYFEVKTNQIVMNLLSYNHKTKTKKLSAVSSMKTYDTTKNKIPFQKVNQNFDINTFDQLLNSNNLEIKTNFTNESDIISTYCRLNELNAVPLKTLKDVSIQNLGTTYMVGLFDIIGDKTIAGTRYFMIFDHTSNSYITIEKNWETSNDDRIWITEFIELLRTSEFEIFKDFSYDFQIFGLESGIYEEKFMLRFRSIEPSYKSRFVDAGISQELKYSKFLEQFELHDVHVYQFLFAISSGYLQTSIKGDLNLQIGETSYLLEDVEFTNMLALQTALKTLKVDINMFIDESRDIFYITSSQNFKISHPAFGTLQDSPRGEQFKYAYALEPGVEVKFGESIIAEFDNENLSDMHDITWKIYDEVTNKLLATQYSSRLVYLAKLRTTYSIKVEYKIHGQKYENYHKGCFLVL